MNTKKIGLLILLSFAAVNLFAQNNIDLELDLNTSLKIAMDNNPNIKIAELEIQRVDYSRKEAIGALLPSVNAQGSYTDNVMKQVMFMPESFAALMGGQRFLEMGYKNSYTGAISAQLPLVNFTIWQNLKNKQTEIDLIIEKTRASKIEMRKQVKDAYFTLLLTKSSLNVLEKSYTNALETLKNIENSYKQGVVSEYDYIRAQVSVNNLNPTLINARNSLDLAKMQLKMILSLPSNINIIVNEELDTYSNKIHSVNTLDINNALVENTELKQMDLNIISLRNQLKLINTQHLPSLTATGNYIYQTQSEDFKFKDYHWVSSASIGLNLNIPLFAGMTKINQAKQVKISINALELQKDYLKEGMSLSVQAAVNSMNAAKEQLIANKDAIKQAQRGYEIAKVRYEVGTGTLLELNDSELSMTQSNLNYQQSLYNYLSAQANLEKVMGVIE
ncbi:MAG: TolC family protein [Bacteroidales bacterium]|nr:TolC family protein [Bacteroidales bacterium]